MSDAVSTEMRAANWDFLWRRFTGNPVHVTVSNRVSVTDDSSLAILLRHHATAAVSNGDEVEFRAAVDRWIGELELFYLAWLCGYVPDPSGQPQGEALLSWLQRVPLRLYYEQHYPVPLPMLFRLHLEGVVRLDPAREPAAAGAFERFTALYERFRGDENLGGFLNFLDSFNYGVGDSRVDIRTVVDAFESPSRIAEAFQRPVRVLNHLDRGIVGLVRFLTFSEDLDLLLQRCSAMPLVQSAFWFSYGYWFTEFKSGVVRESGSAIDKIVASATSDVSHDGRARATEHAAELKALLGRLTDGRYVKALFDEVQRATSRLSGDKRLSADVWLTCFARYLGAG